MFNVSCFLLLFSFVVVFYMCHAFKRSGNQQFFGVCFSCTIFCWHPLYVCNRNFTSVLTMPIFLGDIFCLSAVLSPDAFSELWQVHGPLAFLGMRIACLVADLLNHRVMRWSPGDISGELVAGGHDFGDGLAQLRNPCCFAVGPDGFVMLLTRIIM